MLGQTWRVVVLQPLRTIYEPTLMPPPPSLADTVETCGPLCGDTLLSWSAIKRRWQSGDLHFSDARPDPPDAAMPPPY